MPSTPEFAANFRKDKPMREALRKPFPKEQIGKLPRTAKRPELDYVGHAAVTDRLNDAAPGWTMSEPELLTIGDPERGVTCWIKCSLTVGEVTRWEFGDGKDPKEAIGNWLRRAAMRFGVALDLWSREELQGPGPTIIVHGPTAEQLAVRAAQVARDSPSKDAGETTGSGAGDTAEGVARAEGKAAATPEADLADPAQWAKAASLGMRKVDVLKAVQALGHQVTKASDVTRSQLAEVIAGFGK